MSIDFTENFEIKLEDDKWLINIKQALDDATLKTNSELIITLIATESDMDKEGHAALILRLPGNDNLAPIFSQTYYTANYKISSNEANVVFSNPIIITNSDEISDISLSLYSKYYIK